MSFTGAQSADEHRVKMARCLRGVMLVLSQLEESSERERTAEHRASLLARENLALRRRLERACAALDPKLITSAALVRQNSPCPCLVTEASRSKLLRSDVTAAVQLCSRQPTDAAASRDLACSLALKLETSGVPLQERLAAESPPEAQRALTHASASPSAGGSPSPVAPSALSYSLSPSPFATAAAATPPHSSSSDRRPAPPPLLLAQPHPAPAAAEPFISPALQRAISRTHSTTAGPPFDHINDPPPGAASAAALSAFPADSADSPVNPSRLCFDPAAGPNGAFFLDEERPQIARALSSTSAAASAAAVAAASPARGADLLPEDSLGSPERSEAGFAEEAGSPDGRSRAWFAPAAAPRPSPPPPDRSLYGRHLGQGPWAGPPADGLGADGRGGAGEAAAGRRAIGVQAGAEGGGGSEGHLARRSDTAVQAELAGGSPLRAAAPGPSASARAAAASPSRPNGPAPIVSADPVRPVETRDTDSGALGASKGPSGRRHAQPPLWVLESRIEEDLAARLRLQRGADELLASAAGGGRRGRAAGAAASGASSAWLRELANEERRLQSAAARLQRAAAARRARGAAADDGWGAESDGDPAEGDFAPASADGGSDWHAQPQPQPPASGSSEARRARGAASAASSRRSSRGGAASEFGPPGGEMDYYGPELAHLVDVVEAIPLHPTTLAGRRQPAAAAGGGDAGRSRAGATRGLPGGRAAGAGRPRSAQGRAAGSDAVGP